MPVYLRGENEAGTTNMFSCLSSAPGGPPGALLKQENMLVVPAAFSPLK